MTIDEAIEFAEDINATVTFPSESKLDEEFLLIFQIGLKN